MARTSPAPTQGLSWRMAAVAVVVRRGLPQDRPLLARMLELYQYELSDLWLQDLDARGEYGYPLGRYWSRDDCHPFIVTVNGQLAGFALVDAALRVGSSGHWMDQFFVLKKYRRAGVGRAGPVGVRGAARPMGGWPNARQPRRASFWRKVIGEYTGGRFVEHELDPGSWLASVQCFSSSTGIASS